MKECLLNFHDLFFIFYLLTFQIPHVKDVCNLVPHGGDFGNPDIEAETEQGMSDEVEKPHMIIGKDLN